MHEWDFIPLTMLKDTYHFVLTQRPMNAIILMLVAMTSLLVNTGGAFAAEDRAASSVPLWQTEEQRQKRAADSLWRLERAIRRDGFSSAICALNIWKSNAKDAENFDKAAYDEYKRRIYQKSVDEILNWLEFCIAEGWIREANFWLKVYHLRAVAIDVLDPEFYEAIRLRVQNCQTANLQK